MNEVYLCLGGNIGERKNNLLHAAEQINNRIGKILQASLLYETDPWGVDGQEPYLNQVICIQTPLSAKELLGYLLKLESEMGRFRTNEQWASRIIDIDILYYADLCLESEGLVVPHPRLHLRNFVLVPLQDIAPHYLHPLLKLTTTELLEICPDINLVRLYKD